MTRSRISRWRRSPRRPPALIARPRVGGHAHLHGDPQRIRQILDNLLSHARHATPDGGQITVHVTTQDTSIQVQVTDTGPGIPRPDRERIFDRFTRLEDTHSRRTDGLGLAIARGIASAHSGTLTCIDRAGQGASFRLQLPRQTR